MRLIAAYRWEAPDGRSAVSLLPTPHVIPVQAGAYPLPPPPTLTAQAGTYPLTALPTKAAPCLRVAASHPAPCHRRSARNPQP